MIWFCRRKRDASEVIVNTRIRTHLNTAPFASILARVGELKVKDLIIFFACSTSSEEEPGKHDKSNIIFHAIDIRCWCLTWNLRAEDEQQNSGKMIQKDSSQK